MVWCLCARRSQQSGHVMMADFLVDCQSVYTSSNPVKAVKASDHFLVEIETRKQGMSINTRTIQRRLCRLHVFYSRPVKFVTSQHDQLSVKGLQVYSVEYGPGTCTLLSSVNKAWGGGVRALLWQAEWGGKSWSQISISHSIIECDPHHRRRLRGSIQVSRFEHFIKI